MRRHVALLFVSVLLCAFLAEAAVRGYWLLRHGIPFFAPDRILYVPYPELRSVAESPPEPDDRFSEVLLLGGSSLHESWGQVESELLEQLARAGRRDVRLFNLAQPAHTSRDSLLKYEALEGFRFDLVVVYHGINETRANNAPPELFREDYSHLPWYEIANALAPYHGTSRFALPYTLRTLGLRIGQALAPGRYAPEDAPREAWLRYAAEPRSAASFEANLAAILAIAARRDEPVLLMTFATWVPADYSYPAFRSKQLDCLLHHSPIELWGRREHVVAALEAHNAIVRRLAADHEGVVFVDQARRMPQGGRFYNDPCHFTTVGSQRFAEHLVEALLPVLPGGAGPRADR
jgi:hypothetical protein